MLLRKIDEYRGVDWYSPFVNGEVMLFSGPTAIAVEIGFGEELQRYAAALDLTDYHIQPVRKNKKGRVWFRVIYGIVRPHNLPETIDLDGRSKIPQLERSQVAMAGADYGYTRSDAG